MVQPLLLVFSEELPHAPIEGDVADWVRRCRGKLLRFKQKVESRYNEGTLERLLTWHQAEVRQAATLALGFIGSIRINGILACRLAMTTWWSVNWPPTPCGRCGSGPILRRIIKSCNA